MIDLSIFFLLPLKVRFYLLVEHISMFEPFYITTAIKCIKIANEQLSYNDEKRLYFCFISQLNSILAIIVKSHLPVVLIFE